jgi:hypothetical protein
MFPVVLCGPHEMYAAAAKSSCCPLFTPVLKLGGTPPPLYRRGGSTNEVTDFSILLVGGVALYTPSYSRAAPFIHHHIVGISTAN